MNHTAIIIIQISLTTTLLSFLLLRFCASRGGYFVSNNWDIAADLLFVVVVLSASIAALALIWGAA